MSKIQIFVQKSIYSNFFLEKEDMYNSIIAGGTTGAALALRQGPAVAMVSGGIGALLLGLIEGGSMLMNRFGTEMLKPMTPFFI